MDGTEVMEVEDFGAMATAFRNDDVDALMQMTGQGTVQKEKVGLPRLNINYEAETDDGRPLTRGSWKMYHDGRFIYASDVVVRPLLRTYEYSLWSTELNEGRGGFASKSVQKTSFGGTFPDSTGGNKCGRLTRDEENDLEKDDPAYLNSRAVVCNQVIYGRISGVFKDADGVEVEVSEEPMIAYFKRSGFKPIADFIDGLLKSLVGIRISINRIEGKTKASQNQPAENRDSVLEHLDREAPQSELTRLMHSVLQKNDNTEQ